MESEATDDENCETEVEFYFQSNAIKQLKKNLQATDSGYSRSLQPRRAELAAVAKSPAGSGLYSGRFAREVHT